MYIKKLIQEHNCNKENPTIKYCGIFYIVGKVTD